MIDLRLLLFPVTLFLTFFLPGYITFCALISPKEDKEKFEVLEWIVLPVIISVIITSWISIFLLIGGFFSLPSLLIVILSYSCIVFLKFRQNFLKKIHFRFCITKETLFLIALICVAFVLFFQPFEEIFGYGDGYLQVNIGAMIAKHGNIRFCDPLLAELPDDVVQYFIFKENQQFNNLGILNYSTGEVAPSFLHLYPCWISIFLSSSDLRMALYVTPIFALISLLTIFLFTKNVFDWKIAALSTGLLSLTFLQIWFSRSHSAEVLLQMLIFSGILFFVLDRRSKNKYFLIFSAMAFGLTFLTKVEATLLIIPMFIYTILLKCTGKFEKHFFYFIIPFLLTIVIATVYYFVNASGYVLGSFLAEDIPQELLIAILIAIAISLLTIALLPKKFLNNISKFIHAKIRICQHLIVIGMAVYLVYAILTLPNTEYGFNGWNIIQLALYLSPPLLILGLFGLILLIYKKPYTETYFYLGIFFIFLIFFIPNIHHGWGGPWWMRRYVFSTVPFLCISASFCVTQIAGQIKISRKNILISFLIILLIVPTSSVSLPIFNYVEYRGIIKQTEEIFGSFDNDSVLVFVDVSYPHFAYPLREIYDKNAILLRRDYWGVRGQNINQENMEKFIQAYNTWKQLGKKIYVVSPSDEFVNSFNNEFNFELYKRCKVSFPYLELSVSNFPNNFINIEREITIYQITEIS